MLILIFLLCNYSLAPISPPASAGRKCLTTKSRFSSARGGSAGLAAAAGRGADDVPFYVGLHVRPYTSSIYECCASSYRGVLLLDY